MQTAETPKQASKRQRAIRDKHAIRNWAMSLASNPRPRCDTPEIEAAVRKHIDAVYSAASQIQQTIANMKV